MQEIEVFPATSDDRGRSEGDAPSRMRDWMKENNGMRVVSVTGDVHCLIAVVEPIPPVVQRRDWRTGG